MYSEEHIENVINNGIIRTSSQNLPSINVLLADVNNFSNFGLIKNDSIGMENSSIIKLENNNNFFNNGLIFGNIIGEKIENPEDYNQFIGIDISNSNLEKFSFTNNGGFILNGKGIGRDEFDLVGLYSNENSDFQNDGLFQIELLNGDYTYGIKNESLKSPNFKNNGYFSVVRNNVNNEGFIKGGVVGIGFLSQEDSIDNILENSGHFKVYDNSNISVGEPNLQGATGIYINSKDPDITIGSIKNNGNMESFAKDGSANSVLIQAKDKININSIKNEGNIKNTSTVNEYVVYADNSAIFLYSSKGTMMNIEDFNNSGVIASNGYGGEAILYRAHDLFVDQRYRFGKFENTGIMFGEDSTISLEINMPISNLLEKENNINYGIMAGNNILHFSARYDDNGGVPGPWEDYYMTNKGIYLYTNEQNPNDIEKIVIGGINEKELPEGKDNQLSKTVLNGNIDGTIFEGDGIIEKSEGNQELNSYIKSSNLNNYSGNLIINGVGRNETGALNIDENFKLTNSIINGYETAMVIGEGKTFTGDNITFNGGTVNQSEDGLEFFNTISGSQGNETLILNDSIINGKTEMKDGDDKIDLQKSIINGDIDLGNGNDSLNIMNTIINGDLYGGVGEDNLNFNSSKENDEVTSIFGKIDGFENISFSNKETILFENSKIQGAKNIDIASGSQVTLRVNSAEEENGSYKSHALYNEGKDTILISGDTSSLPTDDFQIIENEDKIGYEDVSIFNIETNGLGINSIIDLGNVLFEKDDERDIYSVWVKTNSILNSAKIVEEEKEDGTFNTSIKIEGEKDLYGIFGQSSDKELLYEDLNEIYKGIYSSGDENFNALNDIVTSISWDECDGEEYTEEEEQLHILLGYLKEVYTATPYSFSNEATKKSMSMFKDVVIDNNFMAHKGEWIIYGGFTHENFDQNQNYYGKNYHHFDTSSVDTNVDIKISGAYGQFEYGVADNLSVGTLIGGNKSDVEIVSSKLEGTSPYVGLYAKKNIKNFKIIGGLGYQYSEYDSTRKTMTDSYDADYSDNAFNLYLNTKYSYKLKENLYLEPSVELSYFYINQEDIDADNSKPLSLNVDSKKFNILEGKVGINIRKEMFRDNSKHSLSGGISYSRILNGNEEDSLIADFGGNDFDILVPHKCKDEISVGANYEVELDNGFLYNFKVNYSTRVPTTINGRKEEEKGDWIIGIGIGYRF